MSLTSLITCDPRLGHAQVERDMRWGLGGALCGGGGAVWVRWGLAAHVIIAAGRAASAQQRESGKQNAFHGVIVALRGIGTKNDL
jgi:hypothetical protein